MGTFRVKSGMWEQFKQLATENGATATDLIISFIENCLQSRSIPQSIQGTDKSPQSNLDDIYTYIDDKLDKNIDTSVKKAISGSLEDGEIGEAIAKSYAAMMGNFNELLTQVQELKAAIPTAVASSPQSPDTSPQSPVTSPHSPDTSPQSPIPNDQSPIERSHIENIRTTLKRKGISATTEQIRAAFFAAGWNGGNYQEIRKDILEILSALISNLISS